MEECVLYDYGGESTNSSSDGTGCWNIIDTRYWPAIKQERSIEFLEIFFIAVFAVVLAVGLIANSLTLAVFCQLKAKLLWNNNNLLILLNLCVCDNITVFFVAPFTFIILVSDRVFQGTLYQQDNDTGTEVACNAIGFLFNYCSRAILLFLAVGAVDRFVAIFIPFKYKSIVTPIRVKASLGLCHVISLLVTVVPFFKNARYTLDMDYAACHYNFEDVVTPTCEDGASCGEAVLKHGDAYVSNPEVVGTAYFFMVILVVIVPGILMIATSVSVVYRLTSRLREKAAEQRASETGSLLKKKENENSDKKRAQKVDPQEQAAVTISYLVLLYTVCYVPWWILSFETFLEYTGTLSYRSLVGKFSTSFTHYFYLYLTLTTLLSSSTNPLIYFGRNRILMDKLEEIIKYKESLTLSRPSLRSTISAPVMSIPTF